jgi:ubiquinone/menaquinone biosynthesis C-methylase UbiE
MEPENGRHEHPGMSSEGMFDANKVLHIIGIEKGMTLVDAGCADGHLSIAASSMVGKVGQIHSIDIHQPSLENLKEKIDRNGIENIDVHLHDLREGDLLSDETADVVLFSNVLHGFIHNGEMGPVMDWVLRIMKKDGKLAIIEFRKDIDSSGPPVEHRVSSDGLKRIMLKFGLHIKYIFNINQDHYLSIFTG